MTLRVVPEGLAATSAAVAALTARLVPRSAAAPAITAVVPAAADPVSLQTAAGFSAQGASTPGWPPHGGIGSFGRRRRGIRASYAAGDAAAAAAYLTARGGR